MIRAFPFTDFGQRCVHAARRCNSPEPFAMYAVHEMVFNKIPDAKHGLEIFPVAGELKSIEKADGRLRLRPAFPASINNFSAFAFVTERAVRINSFLEHDF